MSYTGHSPLQSRHGSHEHHGTHQGQGGAGPVKDPVCGMTVDPLKTPHHATYASQEYHFCGARCRERFVADPARYLGSNLAKVEEVPAGTIYTCPMHPEVVRLCA